MGQEAGIWKADKRLQNLPKEESQRKLSFKISSEWVAE